MLHVRATGMRSSPRGGQPRCPAYAVRLARASSAYEALVAIHFRSSGCMFSIVASVILTIVLNLLLRSC